MGPPTRAAVRSWQIALAVLLVSAWVLSRHGFEAELVHDDGVNIYSGQQMLEGVAPYRSLFDHKSPLTSIVCAPAIALGDALGIDDVLAVRIVFLAISSAVVSLLFLLVEVLFRSRWQAVLTCTVFLGLWGFGVQAASGAFPKTLGLFLALATLWTTTRRRWLMAGSSAALATFVWQPLGVFLLVALLSAWGSGRHSEVNRKAWLAVVVGAAVPSAALMLYFASQGALRQLADGMVLFNLGYLEPTETVGRRLEYIAGALFSFRWMGYGLFVGTLVLLPLYPSRLRAARQEARPFLVDRFAPLLLTLPAPFLWSLVDFQAYPDMFVFLPYGAIGFGWILHLGIEAVATDSGLGHRGTRWLLAAIVLATLLTASFYYRSAAPDAALAQQRAAWQEALADFPAEARIASVGAPHVLALLRRTNVTSYGTVWRGMERYIDERHTGGFQGWLETLGGSDVLIVDGLHPASWPRRFRQEWYRFVSTRFDRRDRLQRVNVLVPKDRHAEVGSGH